MKNILLFVALSTLLFSCSKEEKTSADWSRLAAEKRQEIDNLIANTPCNDISEWSIFTQDDPYGCNPRYFPVHPSIKTIFDKLLAEHRTLEGKYLYALHKEGVIVDPCFQHIWVHQAPIGIACKDNKASLIFIHDLDPEESRNQIAEIYPRIEAYLDELTCEGTDGWTYNAIIHPDDCSISYIPVKQVYGYPSIREDIGLYNAHAQNIINKEKPDCSTTVRESPDGVECRDGKPVVRTKSN